MFWGVTVKRGREGDDGDGDDVGGGEQGMRVGAATYRKCLVTASRPSSVDPINDHFKSPTNDQ